MDRITIDHSTIKRWAEENNGRPQKIPDTKGGKDTLALRIDFPGKVDDLYLGDPNPSVDITWEEFFDFFEKEKLAFVYDPKPEGDKSWDYHFIKRNHVKDT